MKNLFVILIAFVMLFSFTACSSKTNGNGGIGSNPVQPPTNNIERGIKLEKIYNGAEISFIPKAFSDYLSLTEESEIAEYLYKNNPASEALLQEGGTIKFSWSSNVLGSRENTLIVSDKPDFSNVVYTDTAYASCNTNELLPGTYYWKVTDIFGNESNTDTFTVARSVRTMNVGSIKNFRDIGGWKTEDGNIIKYGLCYRSAEFSSSDAEALVSLGIKSEIDLREGNKYLDSVIPARYGLNYLQAGIMQSDYILLDKSYYSSLTEEQIAAKRHDAYFREEFTNALYKAFKFMTEENNYPIDFHCTSGADRTGTFAFLLEGMLGVEIDDLYRDFEITSFTMGGKRWRSDIKVENGQYYFTDDGFVPMPDNYVAMGLLYKGLMTCYKTEDGKLSSAIKNYLKKEVKLTDADFQAISDILLG